MSPHGQAYPPERSSSSDPRPAPIGCIVCKQELHKHTIQRGYIGMLSVQRQWRRKGIARRLIAMAVDAMKANGADEVRLLRPLGCRRWLSQRDFSCRSSSRPSLTMCHPWLCTNPSGSSARSACTDFTSTARMRKSV